MASPSSSGSPSFSPSQPLPSLPIENKRHILAFADTGTLASCSGVSLAFLEIASELLYEHVEIVGEDRLVQFFCERSVASSPQVEAFRVCGSRLKTFTFVATSPDPSSFFPQLLPLPSGPLTVDLLVLKFFPRASEEGRYDIHAPLLSLFDPTTFRFASIPPYDLTLPTFLHLPRSGISQWERLLDVHLFHAGFQSLLDTSWFASSGWDLTFELPTSLENPDGSPSELSLAVIGDLTARFDFPEPEGEEEDERVDMFPSETVDFATIVVRSEEAKVEVEERLKSELFGLTMDDEEVDEQLSHIQVVVRQMTG